MKVAIKIPCIMQHFFSDTAENLKAICQKLNIEYIIPENQTCCGLPFFEKGELAAAKTSAEYNLKVFSEYKILTSSINCFQTYTKYYPKIFNNTVSHNECVKMANNVLDFKEILIQLKNLNFSKPQGNYLYLIENVLSPEFELNYIQKFTNIQWQYPSLQLTSAGSDFSLPVLNHAEAEKITLTLINDALSVGANTIVTLNDIARQQIHIVAKKNGLQINTLHLIDLISYAF